MIAHGSLNHGTGVNRVRNDVFHFPGLQVADMEAKVRQRHAEVAVNLFKILFMLMRRPAGPGW